MVASVLAAVLMAALLAVATGVARDGRLLDARRDAPRHGATIDLIRRDLVNARTMTVAGARRPGGPALVLVGNGGLDPDTKAPTGRLARVVYRVVADRGTRGKAAGESYLVREQEFLDDPVRPRRWAELVAPRVTGLSVVSASPDDGPVADGGAAAPSRDVRGAAVSGRGPPVEMPAADGNRGPGRMSAVPSRVRLRVEFADGAVDDEVRVR